MRPFFALFAVLVFQRRLLSDATVGFVGSPALFLAPERLLLLVVSLKTTTFLKAVLPVTAFPSHLGYEQACPD
jgi:hypothetical protein